MYLGAQSTRKFSLNKIYEDLHNKIYEDLHSELGNHVCSHHLFNTYFLIRPFIRDYPKFSIFLCIIADGSGALVTQEKNSQKT